MTNLRDLCKPAQKTLTKKKLFNAYLNRWVEVEDQEAVYICPACGYELRAQHKLFASMDDEIYGCEFCIQEMSAIDKAEEEEDEED